MTRKDRLRRVAILCSHFTRNLAYYHASHSRVSASSLPFWRTIDGNFLDIALLEWCKLFGDRRGLHCWQKVVTDPAEFRSALLAAVQLTEAEFTAYVAEMRAYRDQFVAHLDDSNKMDIPHFDRARVAVNAYHRHVVDHEAATSDLARLPDDLVTYYAQCFDEAQAILEAHRE